MGSEKTIRKTDYFDAAPDMMCVFSADGRFLDVNQAACRLAGFSREQLLERSLPELAHPDERPLTEAELRKLGGGAPSSFFEHRFRCSDGSYRWLSWSCALSEGLIHAAARDITARKMTEAALLESERTLRRILDLAPMAMSIVAFDGTIEYINAKAEQVFGYRHELIPTMERWWAQAYPDPDYRAEVVERWTSRVRKAIEENSEIKGGKYQVTCWDGSEKTVFIFGVIAAGKVFVMFDDITTRERAEEALRESETTLRRVLDHTPIPIGIQDLEGRIDYVNRRFTQVFGYEQKDIPDVWRWADRAYPDPAYRAAVLKRWRELIDASARNGGDVEGGEYKVTCADGSVKTAYIFGMVTGDKLITILDDITARVEAEAALRASEARYRALVETTGTGYVILAPDGTVENANGEYARLAGYDEPSGVTGLNVVEWTAPHDKERNAEAVKRCMADGSVRNLEVDYAAADGTTIPVEVNATVLREDGREHILALCRDITPRRMAEDEIRALNSGLERRVKARTAELTEANQGLLKEMEQRMKAEKAKEKLQEELLQSQKMDAIGRLAGGIAHDFNNILVAISGYAEFLLKTMPEGAPARSDINEILQETERGAGLTRQLLTVSRKQPMQLRNVDLNESVRSAESMLKRLIGANMHMELALDPGIAPIKADQGQIVQVIMNLVINARDAMPDGGRIIIKTANAVLEAGRPDMKLAPAPGEYVMLSVKDTGCGMDPGTAARLFEPFFTTKEQGKGTGLGLSTVYGIVSQAGGGIALETAPGAGTTFSLYFPRVVAIGG